MTNSSLQAGDVSFCGVAPTKTPPGSPIHHTTGGLCSSYTASSSSTCDCRSALEDEAVAAVREFSFAVNTICISEMLPRTSELLFLNITTLEHSTYCVELTGKGWRIASHRQDCMNGDFRQLSIHTKYYESLAALLDAISPEYREKFGSRLISKLNDLKASQDRDSQ